MILSRAELGWDRHFDAQIDVDDPGPFARVAEVHRDRIVVRGTQDEVTLDVGQDVSTGEVAVGDWVRYDAQTLTMVDVLERKTALRRMAPGTSSAQQLIAANVDTLFIVTSCNADFNPARLERYLALASAGNIIPVIVLTKADLSDAAEDLRKQAQRLSPLVTAVTVNALDESALDQLLAWLRPGDTGALVGSSGVGKSTILNTLTGAGAATQGIREDDAKGRHTTTARSLRRTRSGGWLIDTPGIRQLALVNSAEAINEVFSDVTDLIDGCRFSDCAHDTEPGCAVRRAVEAGTLDADRVRRWRKLHLEDLYNSETADEKRSRHKSFSKKVRSAIDGKRGPKR